MKKIIILGAAESGVGAAMLATKQGFEVFVSEKGKIKETFKKELTDLNIPFEENFHSEEKILNADEIIKSPGIGEKTDIMKKIRAKNIPVISEIEFASRYTTGKIIAITGTNGKSTTTSLIYDMMKREGLDVSLVGNIGFSFAKQICLRDTKYYVAEISSFQLDDCYDFHPHVALILNISENHLDRYDYDFKKYAASKFRLIKNLTANDFFIYGADSKELMENFPQNIQAQLLPFSMTLKHEPGAWLEADSLFIKTKNQFFTMSIYELGLQGKHNLFNSLAAGIAGNVLDLKKENIRESLSDFKSLEHRLEFVANIHGIEFINDSKSTTVNSAWYALESMNKPVVWIAGGVDKGNDYSILTDLIRSKVKAIVCMGADNRKIHEAFSSSVDLIVNTANAEEAVKAAYHFATKGDAVLLSPACASFDLFENFEDRGRQFKKYVRSL